MTFNSDLEIALRARFPLVIVTTAEEPRVVNAIKEVCSGSGRACVSWDLGAGFVTLVGRDSYQGSDPLTALDQIDRIDDGNKSVFILKDFHEFWNDALVKRRLRNTAQMLRRKRASIVITTPVAAIPAELRDEAVPLEVAPPDADELTTVLDGLSRSPGVEVRLTALGKQKLVQAAVGMTKAQAERAFSHAIVVDGRLDDDDIDLVNREKKAILRESEALEFFSAQETPDDVGGLDALKSWLQLRERAFSNEAADYGLPAPKGIALIGIPGTGKSLTAKMIGGLWRLPLLRLDVGALFGSLVGESEERVRRALQLTEAIAPCVLWIDELEKSFSSGGLDGGTSQRVFGAVLTWMQEKKEPVFVVATANDVSKLPPELLRRGRFDEVFFLDLPTESERRDILTVHLRKRGRMPQLFDLDHLVSASAGYVGAELEQAVIDAMYVAFNDSRDITTDDVGNALRHLVPLSRSQSEVVEVLRDWLRDGRAQSASFQQKAEAEEAFIPLELG